MVKRPLGLKRKGTSEWVAHIATLTRHERHPAEHQPSLARRRPKLRLQRTRLHHLGLNSDWRTKKNESATCEYM